MDDLTQTMYDAARRAYDTLHVSDGYTGLVYGLAAVARALGFDCEPMYFSRHFHSPLAELAGPFGKETLTFPDLVRLWDRSWYDRSTGRLLSIEYPYGEPHQIYTRSGHHPVSLKWIETKVQAKMRELKLRRNTKKYQEFVSNVAQEVVDSAVQAAQESAVSQVRDLDANMTALERHYDHAASRLARLEEHELLHQSLLKAAGVPESPEAASETQHQRASWSRAASLLKGKLDYLVKQRSAISDPNFVAIEAVRACEQSDVLKPFPKALGLTV